MSDTTPTMQVLHKLDKQVYRINSTDFNPAIHEKATDEGSNQPAKFDRASAMAYLKENKVDFKANISNEKLEELVNATEAARLKVAQPSKFKAVEQNGVWFVINIETSQQAVPETFTSKADAEAQIELLIESN